MPPLEAVGMCSECVSPAWHTPRVTYSTNGGGETGGPCPAWPRWAQGVSAASEALRWVAQGPAEGAPPPPRPIAVLAPGVPIEDVIARLTAIPAPRSVRAETTAGNLARCGTNNLPAQEWSLTALTASQPRRPGWYDRPGRTDCS